MSDPLRTDSSSALDATPAADRDGKIEELLLFGLDHYFAGHYEDAINIWTRALFLDRNHPRARAYIERARSAQAERLRESEELLQTGLAAFRRGDAQEARRLLRAAVDTGAPAEEAQALLERLNRFEDGPSGAPRTPTRDARMVPTPPVVSHNRWPMRALLLGSVTALAVGVVAIVASSPRGRQLFDGVAPPASTPALPVPRESTLPLPRRGELAMARARALAQAGRFHDALAMLDVVGITDAQKPDADRLRADLQRQLLALSTSGPPARAR